MIQGSKTGASSLISSGQMEWVSGQHFPWRKKCTPYAKEHWCQIHGRSRTKRAYNYKLKEELLGPLLQGLWHVMRNGECLCLRLAGAMSCVLVQGIGKDAWSTVICCSWPRMTFGWLECARARWMIPESAQAWGWCQTRSCSYWIPVACTCLANCSWVEDVPCLESKWQRQELKAKYNMIKPT